MKQLILLLYILFLLPLAIYPANKLHLDARWWFGDLETKVLHEVNGVGVGNYFDFKNELDIEKRDLRALRVEWETGHRHKVGFSFHGQKHMGDTTTINAITYGGIEYPIGTKILSKYEHDYADFMWTWWFLTNSSSKFKIGTLLEVKSFRLKTSLDAQNQLGPLYLKEREYSSTLPCVGFSFQYTPDPLVVLFSDISGIKSGKKGYFLDVDAGFRLCLTPAFAFQGGYRILRIYVKENPDYSRSDFEGAYVGFIFSFF
ncbi:hypothetical protein KAJ27_05445 [bacterium]|nr:hypothetical protein [bacterium]